MPPLMSDDKSYLKTVVSPDVLRLGADPLCALDNFRSLTPPVVHPFSAGSALPLPPLKCVSIGTGVTC